MATSEQKSAQIKHLNEEEYRRYVSKLTIEGTEYDDPYKDKIGWIDNCADWPEIQYADVYNYHLNDLFEYFSASM